jgi:hypothetical protein
MARDYGRADAAHKATIASPSATGLPRSFELIRCLAGGRPGDRAAARCLLLAGSSPGGYLTIGGPTACASPVPISAGASSSAPSGQRCHLARQRRSRASLREVLESRDRLLAAAPWPVR